MKSRLPVLFPVLTLLVPALRAQDADKIELKVAARLGDSASFVSRARQEQQIDMGGQQVEAGNELTHDFTIQVTEVGDDGVLTATVVLQRIRGNFVLPMMGELEFDTKDAGKAEDDDAGGGFMPSAGTLRKAMSALVGKEFKARVEPNGRVTELAGLDAALEAARSGAGTAAQMLGSALNEGSVMQLVRGAFGPFPKQPVAVGDNWQGDEMDAGSKEMPLDRKTTLVLAKADGDQVEIEIKGTLASKQGKEGAEGTQTKIENGKIAGRVIASRKDGFVVRAESKVTMDVTASGPMGEMQIGIRSTNTLERATAAEEPKK